MMFIKLLLNKEMDNGGHRHKNTFETITLPNSSLLLTTTNYY